MDRRGPLRLLLELDASDGDALSGRLGFGHEVHEFSGWLSLIAVIENVRQRQDGARSPPERGWMDLSSNSGDRDRAPLARRAHSRWNTGRKAGHNSNTTTKDF